VCYDSATITNAAIGACDNGGQREKALRLFKRPEG
jgi:hypothetical protein